MSDLALVPWSGNGKKRPYMKTAGGTEVDHIDLVTGAIVATADGFADELAAIARGELATPEPTSTALQRLVSDVCMSTSLSGTFP